MIENMFWIFLVMEQLCFHGKKLTWDLKLIFELVLMTKTVSEHILGRRGGHGGELMLVQLRRIVDLRLRVARNRVERVVSGHLPDVTGR